MRAAAVKLWPCSLAAAQALASTEACQRLHMLAGSTLPTDRTSHTHLQQALPAHGTDRLAWHAPSTSRPHCRAHDTRQLLLNHQPWQTLHLHAIHKQGDQHDSSKQHTPTENTAVNPTVDKPSSSTLDVAVDSLWTAPNMLSVARAISGPFIAALILNGNWPWALTATAVSGLSDWADGALARRLGQSSVLGSYLDPLADKVLVTCVVGALAVQGSAPTWLAVLVVGRDVGLVTGMALHRWRSLGWRVRGVTMEQFFDTRTGTGVPFMKPLLISKVNTVLQLGFVCGCMTHAWVQLPDSSTLHQLELLTAATTAASLGAYMWVYATGKLLPLPQEASGERA